MKNPTGPSLHLHPTTWTAFQTALLTKQLTTGPLTLSFSNLARGAGVSHPGAGGRMPSRQVPPQAQEPTITRSS
ncbi:hypothetical protein GCM10010307_71490 [Streptomyces vastus]|uniref:DUF397 domain-containing protein n=1 Tax=Streptomyces vastus TaxID=285451 RepID=A0ABP6E4F3_9ACTN